MPKKETSPSIDFLHESIPTTEYAPILLLFFFFIARIPSGVGHSSTLPPTWSVLAMSHRII